MHQQMIMILFPYLLECISFFRNLCSDLFFVPGSVIVDKETVTAMSTQ